MVFKERNEESMKKSGLMSMMLLSAVLMVGCGNQSAQKEKTPDTESTEKPSATEEPSITEEPSATEVAPESTNAGTDTADKSTDATSHKEITMDEAKKIALEKAGLRESDGTWKQEKKEKENGRMVYDLEFIKGKKEYEFEIDAEKGTILEYNVESKHDK